MNVRSQKVWQQETFVLVQEATPLQEIPARKFFPSLSQILSPRRMLIYG